MEGCNSTISTALPWKAASPLDSSSVGRFWMFLAESAASTFTGPGSQADWLAKVLQELEDQRDCHDMPFRIRPSQPAKCLHLDAEFQHIV